jgi:glycosyltransferase involved in cell wall biosynthesis
MPKILFVYDYFYPAYKAGGPIQSLTNLAIGLLHKHEVSIFTGCNDHNTADKLTDIDADKWSAISLPGTAERLQVWYANRKTITKHLFRSILKDAGPAVIYLNGIFSYRFIIIPLLAVNPAKNKIVIAPRGMLQAGALAGKSIKKKLYLTALKLSGLVKNVTWHATNEEEERDIRKAFGNNIHVTVAANIAKAPVNNITGSEKAIGQLRLIYLSLIAAKKNLLQAIELINKLAANITLDIYGPVKDAAYWKKCEQAIAASDGKVNYKGDIRPELVQDTFAKYDASILLTKGENFGHALYESMSAGRPIITSYFTPWNELEQKRTGWNLDIADNDVCLNRLESICNLDNDSFNIYCNGAYEMAKLYYRESSDLSSYYEIFSPPDPRRGI